MDACAHEYGKGLAERLSDLHDRVQSGAYRARPSRRVEIPKPDGGTRPLGIAAVEDKIVQKAPGDHPFADIRAGVPRIQLWVPTRTWGA